MNDITYQRFKFFGSHQFKFRNKVIKVFVTSVDMGFGSNLNQAIKVMNVDMDEDTE